MPAIKNTSPRGYLSWSQLSLYEKDPNLYYQVYWEGIDQFKTKYLELGKRMADTLENGYDVEHDELFELVAVFMPAYPKREFEIKVTHEGIPLVMKLDGWNEATMTLGEYKTGKCWTQAMADQSGQITMYALGIWKKFKISPKKIKIFLHWAKTEEDEYGELKLTGDIKTFETKRSLADLILFSEQRIKPAWKGICEAGKFMKS